MENLLSILPVLATDLSLVDFTFWIGFAAMLAATMFFFSAMNLVADKWKTSMLVSALITGIAALHYYYMRNAAMEGDITTAYRYVDWILTVRVAVVVRGAIPDQVADPVVESLHAKIMADLTLGGYAIDIQPIGVTFDIVEADQPAGVVMCDYRVQYRTSVTNLAS